MARRAKICADGRRSSRCHACAAAKSAALSTVESRGNQDEATQNLMTLLSYMVVAPAVWAWGLVWLRPRVVARGWRSRVSLSLACAEQHQNMLHRREGQQKCV
jgi:hypothetical protein